MYHEQRVSQPNNWLHNGSEVDRTFGKVAYLPDGVYWAECTSEEKEDWEREHETA